MNKEERDHKRRRRALNRVETAVQLFENEIKKAERFRDYYPDLDDLEMLARYFEGAAKAIQKLNNKAIKQGRICHEEISMDSDQ